MSDYSLHIPSRHSTDRCPGFLTDLVLRCAAHDEAALGTLFDHLYPVVISIVRDRTPPGAADALVLATFRRLWEQAPTFDPKVRTPVEWVVAQTRAVRAEFLLADVPRGRGPRAALRRTRFSAAERGADRLRGSGDGLAQVGARHVLARGLEHEGVAGVERCAARLGDCVE
ncbi:MAG: hypothetical protein JWP74_1788 [Marmoricola sp.]|nr:hypothetical protein [Marmoricola sp.]